MSNVGELLREAASRLRASDDAAGEAQILLAHLLQKDRSWLFAWSDRALDAQTERDFRKLVERRAAGTPIAYLTGRRGFWSLELQVDRHTLIPRPETEHLVEQALRSAPAERALQVLDLGSGSGAIALALAHERPHWQVTGCDRSAGALAVARANALRLQLSNVSFVESDWFVCLPGRYDLILSNPPYIAEADPHLAQGDLRFEPREALAAGADGLDDIRRIVAGAPAHLNPGGQLWLEHGFEQGPACRRLLQDAGFVAVRTLPDLAGHDRLSGGEIPT
jgi:release factor glutamine methyltransferase